MSQDQLESSENGQNTAQNIFHDKHTFSSVLSVIFYSLILYLIDLFYYFDVLHIKNN